VGKPNKLNFWKTGGYLFQSRRFQNFGSKSSCKNWLDTLLGKTCGLIQADRISSRNTYTDCFDGFELYLSI